MKPAARIVPDVPSFSVDGGFWYSIPEHLADGAVLGAIVRAPLSGRRVRGWVVEVGESDSDRLKEVAGVAGTSPVFDQSLYEGLVWAANHYVAPVATLLARATPPNLPKRIPDAVDITPAGSGHHPLRDLAERTAAGKRSPMTALVGNWRTLDWLSAVETVLAAGRSVLVIAASVAEVETVAGTAQIDLGSSVVSVTGDADANDTRAWEAAQSPPRLVIGTPRVASWQIVNLGLAVVLEENRRAMKDRQSPTIHVRDLLVTRSRLERFNVVFFGPTPGVELLAAGADLVSTTTRPWPNVEVVDRSADRSGYLASRVVAAIKGAVSGGHRVFVYTHRRVGAASTRCSRCRTLRLCTSCGLRLGKVERCPNCSTPSGPCSNCSSTEFEEMGTIPERLVTEISRKVGDGVASVHPGDTPVTVGTERDLAGLGSIYLAIAADVDGILMGSGYRTSEEALRQLARLATTVVGRSGSRLMLQTSSPDSDLVTTLRRGDSVPYIQRVLVERARDRFPPSSEMIAIEIRGKQPPEVDLSGLGGDVSVLGPMEVDEGRRWLLMGNLTAARQSLRPIVGRWRDGGSTVRVDVDPIDV